MEGGVGEAVAEGVSGGDVVGVEVAVVEVDSCLSLVRFDGMDG